MKRLSFVILLSLCLASCGDIYRYLNSGEVSKAINKEIREEHAQQIKIAQLTDFAWDELYLFGPYSVTSEICKTLELGKTECESTITVSSTDDGQWMMVFRENKHVVHTELHLGWHGYFMREFDEPFTPESALFSVTLADWSSNGIEHFELDTIKID